MRFWIKRMGSMLLVFDMQEKTCRIVPVYLNTLEYEQYRQEK